MREKRYLDKKQLEEYVKLGYSQNKMSKIMKESPEMVSKSLEHWGLKNSKYIKNVPFRVRPDIDKKWLIENWVNTPYSMRELAERESINISIIDERRAKFKLKKNAKYQINNDKIFNLEDINIWYLAGLIATDGYLPLDHDCVEIDLSGDSEKKLLEDIRNYLESNAPIGNWGGKAYRLSITVTGIQKFFSENFNIPLRNKTFDINVPNTFPSEEHAKAYILGCMDGDGCIMPKDKFGGGFEICCGSEKFLNGVRDILIKYLKEDINPIRYESRKNPVDSSYPVLNVGGKKAFRILDWIYSSNCCLKLERKYLRYKG